MLQLFLLNSEKALKTAKRQNPRNRFFILIHLMSNYVEYNLNDLREKERFTRISNRLITFQQVKKEKKMDHKLIFDAGLLRNAETFMFDFYAQLNLKSFCSSFICSKLPSRQKIAIKRRQVVSKCAFIQVDHL